MSVSGISTSLSTYGTQSGPSSFQQIQKEFQQLGQDLQSGNLSAAQSDFATLQKLVPKISQASSGQSSNPLLQDFAQLSTDLQSGNLSAAQQDYTNIQQAFQHFSPSSGAPRGHHHHSGSENTLGQLFSDSGDSEASTQSSTQTGPSGVSVNV